MRGMSIDNGQDAEARPVAEKQANPTKPSAGLTMQIILRRDLLENLDWPVGPLMAQAAHAATAVLVKFREHDRVTSYEQDLDNMRKAILQVPDEAGILALRDDLKAAGIEHYLWTEQPENYPTALAIIPNKREKKLKKILDNCKVELWR